MMDVNQDFCGDLFTIYMSTPYAAHIKLTVLYVNYIIMN